MRFLVVTLLLTQAAAVSAQPASWEFPTSGSTVALASERPVFDDGFLGNADFSVLTSAWLFTTTQAVGPVRLVGELPFAYASVTENVVNGQNEISGFALGNAQIGVEADLLVGPVTAGGYVRVPTATFEDAGGVAAQFVGVFSDVERTGLYIEDLVTVSAMVEARPDVLAVPGLSFRLRATPQVLIPTEEGFNDDIEVVIGYAAQAFFSTGVARIGGGLSGAGIVTQDIGDPVEMSVGAMADAGLGPVRLGLTGRLPVVGESKDLINGVVGLRLTYGVD